MEALRQAFNRGYADLAYLQKDADLANLRRSPKFRQFLESLTSHQTT